MMQHISATQDGRSILLDRSVDALADISQDVDTGMLCAPQFPGNHFPCGIGTNNHCPAPKTGQLYDLGKNHTPGAEGWSGQYQKEQHDPSEREHLAANKEIGKCHPEDKH